MQFLSALESLVSSNPERFHVGMQYVNTSVLFYDFST